MDVGIPVVMNGCAQLCADPVTVSLFFPNITCNDTMVDQQPPDLVALGPNLGSS